MTPADEPTLFADATLTFDVGEPIADRPRLSAWFAHRIADTHAAQHVSALRAEHRLRDDARPHGRSSCIS